MVYLCHKAPCKFRNICLPLAERRYLNWNNIDPIKQILSKFSLIDKFFNIFIGNKYHFYINAGNSITPNPLYFSFLQHA